MRLNTLILLLVLSSFSFTKEIEKLQSLSGSAIQASPTVIGLQDDKYGCIVAGNCSPVLDIYKSRFYVKLWYGESEQDHHTSNWNVDVDYRIKLYDMSGQLVHNAIYPVKIDYNPGSGSVYQDIDYEVYETQNFIRAELEILTVSSSFGPGNIPDDVHFDLVYESEQYPELNVAHAPIISRIYDADRAELNLSWTTVVGAESYDLEWLFVDMGDAAYSSPSSYDFKNATRINTSSTNYTISLAYPRGYFLFRTRAVQTKRTSSGTERIVGKWNAFNSGASGSFNGPFPGIPFQYFQSSGITCSGCPAPAPTIPFKYNGLEKNRNWQYSVTYAEEGKRKEAITYFDGSLRNRQQVTLSSTDDRAIVGETIYDYVGRPAVNTLPAPQDSNKGMRFYYNQNRSSALAGLYGYEDFDEDGNYNNPSPIDSVNSRGGAHYYSRANTTPFGINDQYIPTANGYSFTRVQYKNDGTNRVKKQSGVGATFKTGSKKETVYVYGKPTQEELDRLFGNEAGYVEMYKKNAVVDPNGQASISYIDNYGRTIATALSGDIPAITNEEGEPTGDVRLLPIDTRPDDFETITSDLSPQNYLDQRGRMVITQAIVVTAPAQYDFAYTLSDSGLANLCIDSNGCYYDYEIYITDEYGEKVTFTNSKTEESGTKVSQASINFSVYFNQIGSYQLFKVLSIHEDSLNAYLQELSDSNACLDVVIDSVTSCNPTCEDACWSGYVTVSETGDSTFMDDNGNVIAIYNSAGNRTSVGNTYTTSTANTAMATLRAEVKACLDKCDSTFTPTFNPCELKYNVLVADMSPGGQYFDAPDASGTPYGWLINNVRNTPNCLPGMSSWADVAANWQDSWGDIMVVHHPEFCAYQVECCPVLSENGSVSACTKVLSPHADLSNGICSDIFVQDSIDFYMADYMGTGIPTNVLFTQSFYTSHSAPRTNSSGVNTLLDRLYNPTDGVITVQGIMSSADFIQSTRNFYGEWIKYRYIRDYDYSFPLVDDHVCDGYEPFLQGTNGITSEGFFIRYPENPLYENFPDGSNLPSVQQSICSDKALDLVNDFFSGYGCKGILSSADSIALRNALLTKAQNNCTAGDPVTLGLDNEATTFLAANGYPKGCATGGWMEDPSDYCNCDNFFNFLANANGKSISEIVQNPSYATSSASVNALTLLLTTQDNTNGVTPADLASWFSNCNNATPLSTTYIPDYFRCIDSIPVDSNGCVSSINELAYFNELARVRAQTLDSMTAYRTRYMDACFGNIKTRESLTMTYTLREYHYTLYYYDQAGNLIKTVPPEGVFQKDKGGGVVHNSTSSSNINLQGVKDHRAGKPGAPFLTPPHLMVTNYRYNSLNQLTSQNTPDGDSSHFFYDALGRLVASQNADQLERGNTLGKHIYSYTKFDELGRMIEVGEIEHTVQLTETIARDTVEYILRYAGTNQLFGWLSNTSASKTQKVNTYYDEQNTGILATTELKQQNLRNRIASVTYDKDGTGGYESATHYTYDINGNVDTLLQENKALIGIGGTSLSTTTHQYKRIHYEYDLVSGNVNKVAYQPGTQEAFYHRYEYDADNRLTVAYTSKNDVIWEKESKNFYYAHGPLARTEIGDRQVQAQDYAYTLQGWLKTINSSMGHQDRDIGQDGIAGTINAYFGRDVYGFSLHYYRGDYQAKGTSSTVASTIASYGNGDFSNKTVDLYNGNISAMIVGLTKHNNEKAQVIGNTYRYDQLNRIKEYTPFLGEEVGHIGAPYEENSMDPTVNMNERYNTTYTYDGNGNIESLTRKGSEFVQNPSNPTDPNDVMGVPVEMDEFTYEYQNKNTAGAKINNRLDHLADVVDPSNYSDDLDGQPLGNYSYDKLGRLTSDLKEDITNIIWNVANKITQITKGSGQIIQFTYDPMGNRIAKKDIAAAGEKTTFYIRDAQGNVMATYTENKRQAAEPFTLDDYHIYGSSRLGTKQENLTLVINGNSSTSNDFTYRKLGLKRYELSNHLGNVMQVISDRKLPNGDGTDIAYYEAEVISYSDYYPFGMLMPNRHGQDDDYRYGYQGSESDDEVRGTKGASYNYGARMLDVRIGRWLSVDPLEFKFPYSSPYAFVLNLPTNAVDPDGQDVIVLTATTGAAGLGHGAVLVGNDKDGWTFISKDGTYGSSSNSESTGPPNKNKATEKFGSLDEFLKSSHNNHDGKPYYDGAYLIKNTESSLHKDNGGKLTSDEIDKKMIDAGEAQKTKTYIVTSQSCIDVVSDALDAGGHHPGTLGFWASVLDLNPTNRTYWGKNHAGYHISMIPNTRKKRIWEMNKGKKLSTDVDEETKKKFKKDFEDASKAESEVSTPETESNDSDE